MGHSAAAAPDSLSGSMEEIPHQLGKEHDECHEHANSRDDRQTPEEKIVQRQPEHVSSLTQGLPRPEDQREWSSYGEKQDSGDETDESGGNRDR
jgi:hypothetical protein